MNYQRLANPVKDPIENVLLHILEGVYFKLNKDSLDREQL